MRTKGKDAIVPALDSQAPGLVNYLKQVHGLNKKRAATGKPTPASTNSRRGSSNEPLRPNISRPILPKLDLPAAGTSMPHHGTHQPRRGRPTDMAPAEIHHQVGSVRHANLVPAVGVPGVRTAALTEEHRRPPGRRWPWIQPTPIVPDEEPSGVTPEANAALQALNNMPVHPTLPLLDATNPEGGAVAPTEGSYTELQPAAPSPANNSSQPITQNTYQQYGIGNTPSPPHQVALASSSPIHHNHYTSSSPPYHADAGTYQTTPPELPGPSSSPVYSSPGGQDVPRTPIYTNYGGYPYAVSPQPSQSSSPSIPSPSMTAAAAAASVGHVAVHNAPDDVENQPFVVTPEYEAMANARFEAAVRSGAMQASMTPTMLSPSPAGPIAGGSAGYFAHAPDPLVAPPHQTRQTHQTHQQHQAASMQQGEYPAYAHAPHQQQRHDLMHYQQQQQRPQPVRTSAEHAAATYYPPAGPNNIASHQHQQWYGP